MYLPLAALVPLVFLQAPPQPVFGKEELRAAARVAALEFTDAELALLEKDALELAGGYRALFPIALENELDPAFTFDPRPPGMHVDAAPLPLVPVPLPAPERPADLDDLAFADLPTLAALVRARKVSCVELAKSTLARVRRLDAQLHAVVNVTEERALAQAERLDRELAEGRWRGLLHGIPWGAKDLFAVAGTPTTWGSKLYEAQRIERDATVVARLDAAGAVLVCKTSLGEFAYGDLWFGGRTRTPWNPEKGSSGSSAGSASLVAAGGLPFALGTETLGSIVSPCTACGATGIRPSFGRVPRTGGMNLSWTMDKVGPIARSVLDASIVLEAVVGPDGADPAVRYMPFRAREAAARDVRGWRVGYLAGAFERARDDAHVLDELRALGVELVPIDLPDDVPLEPLLVILTAEAATAFDALTRDGRDDQMAWQAPQAWPNTFRAARLIPAVEYLRAQRLRTRVMRALDARLGDLRAFVHPTFGNASLVMTNLTGHPAIVCPSSAPLEDGAPRSITFTGRVDREEELVRLADVWQRASGFHRAHPTLEAALRKVK
ncbi:MAG: amidase [Planctomycetes bacterium]|nr:amidase [Planctomycetota bacterium]